MIEVIRFPSPSEAFTEAATELFRARYPGTAVEPIGAGEALTVTEDGHLVTDVDDPSIDAVLAEAARRAT